MVLCAMELNRYNSVIQVSIYLKVNHFVAYILYQLIYQTTDGSNQFENKLM